MRVKSTPCDANSTHRQPITHTRTHARRRKTTDSHLSLHFDGLMVVRDRDDRTAAQFGAELTAHVLSLCVPEAVSYIHGAAPRGVKSAKKWTLRHTWGHRGLCLDSSGTRLRWRSVRPLGSGPW